MGFLVYRVAKKDREKHPIPWGTWDELCSELEVVFGDPNEERNKLTKLENLTMKTGQTAMEFFQEFNLYAYGKKEDPQAACTQPIQPRNTPIEYSKWRQAIIDTNNIEREFHDATSHHPTTAASSSKDAAAAHDKTHSKSGLKSKSKDKKKPFF